MDDDHLAAALVYVAMNPVRARLCARPTDWRWSSVHALLGQIPDDGVTAVAPVLERFPDLADRIAAGEDHQASARLRKAEQIGRPVGTPAFIAGLERQTARRLLAAKRGRRAKVESE